MASLSQNIENFDASLVSCAMARRNLEMLTVAGVAPRSNGPCIATREPAIGGSFVI